jgi:hypothetical protein
MHQSANAPDSIHSCALRTQELLNRFYLSGEPMKVTRRNLIQDLAGVAGLSSLLGQPGFAETLHSAMQQSTGDGDHGNSAAFWGSFTDTDTHARGLFHKAPGTDSDRQVNFMHYSPAGLRYSEQIETSELPDYQGDVSASVNVGGVRLSTEDRAKFAELRSAQLRIDLLQGQRMYDMIDPLAWMALAAIFPDKGGQLPPLQNLSFDPATSMQNMQKIVLPGGLAHLAVNVSMMHRESPFWAVLNALAQDTAKLAPILGLPAISVTALSGFSKLYGLLENRTTFLFQARPTIAYTTQDARSKAQNTTIGMNLPAGDYVLVPQAHTEELKPHLEKMKLVSGYLVPKDAPTSSSVYEQALNAKPDISYVTIHIGINPLMQLGPPQVPTGSTSSGAASSSKASSKTK